MCVEVLSAELALWSAGSCEVGMLLAVQASWSAGSCGVEMLSAVQVVVSVGSCFVKNAVGGTGFEVGGL